MSAETLFIFFMSIVLLHIKPGPGQALRVTTALKNGFWPAMMMGLGVQIICSLYLVIAVVGSSYIFDFFQNAAFFFKIAGGLYLIYLGTSGFQKPDPESKSEVVADSKSYIHYFLLGCVVSLSNPIDIFFFAGILPGLIDMAVLSAAHILQFVAIMVVTCLIIDVLILSIAVQSKIAFADNPYAKHITFAANIGFILIGAFLLYMAFLGQDYSFEIL